jgi:hypothetical protein
MTVGIRLKFGGGTQENYDSWTKRGLVPLLVPDASSDPSLVPRLGGGDA